MLRQSQMSYEEIAIAWTEEIELHEILSDKECTLLADFCRTEGGAHYVGIKPLYARRITGYNRGQIMRVAAPQLSQCMEWAWHHGLSVTISPMKNSAPLNGSHFQVTVAAVNEDKESSMTSIIGLATHDEYVGLLLAEAIVSHNRKCQLSKSETVSCSCGHLRSEHEASKMPNMWMGCTKEGCDCDIYLPPELCQ